MGRDTYCQSGRCSATAPPAGPAASTNAHRPSVAAGGGLQSGVFGAAPTDAPLAPDTRELLSNFYRQYRTSIYRRCRRMLAVDAEDAVQEVFLRVAANLESAPPSAESLFWVQRVARNYCLNEIRSERRRRQSQDDPSSQQQVTPGRSDELLAARDLARRIVFQMPDRMTVAAWLHYVEGLTQEEVGQALGLSRRTIVTYLTTFRTRAVETLRDVP